MSKQTEISTYHKNAKDAGNRLSAYITNASIGAVAVYFLALTQQKIAFNPLEKTVLILALFAFVVSSFLRLFELHLDAKRFYVVAIELNKDEDAQSWITANRYKEYRLKAIWLSYKFFSLGVLCSFVYMIIRII